MDGLRVSTIYKEDLPTIVGLANKVVEQYVFPGLSEQGQQSIRKSLDKDTSDIPKDSYQALKAEIRNQIVGYVAWRNGYHIAHLYVDAEYQGKGIGRLLLNEVIKRTSCELLKVRSSLNAVPFYTKMGFVQTGNEAEINGIKFLPMEYTKRT